MVGRPGNGRISRLERARPQRLGVGAANGIDVTVKRYTAAERQSLIQAVKAHPQFDEFMTMSGEVFGRRDDVGWERLYKKLYGEASAFGTRAG